MIGFLRGKIIYKTPTQIIIETNGVGFLVNIPLSTYYIIDKREEVELFIYTKVREDQIALYGFAHLEEKEIFEKLITISGIGPKAALALLSGLSIDELYDAIERQDARRLSRIPGIGNKTSERIVLEMRDKIKKREEKVVVSLISSKNDELRMDLVNALINLGYNNNEAKNAAEKVLLSCSTDDFAVLLKESLKMLMR
jgi:Holliday junction DNA helicase RuvA